ncbi:unnamed protein product [Hydatigera taeniaeformis]|uniref:Uncharacterized protein n=1 Tax=Hydatigena taeniaeformis TaxID=6205 RepID=A0A0R3X2M1_HYDTA|nr:unnamed protein product [Hydatigera taeniaeformis]
MSKIEIVHHSHSRDVGTHTCHRFRGCVAIAHFLHSRHQSPIFTLPSLPFSPSFAIPSFGAPSLNKGAFVHYCYCCLDGANASPASECPREHFLLSAICKSKSVKSWFQSGPTGHSDALSYSSLLLMTPSFAPYYRNTLFVIILSRVIQVSRMAAYYLSVLMMCIICSLRPPSGITLVDPSLLISCLHLVEEPVMELCFYMALRLNVP